MLKVYGKGQVTLPKAVRDRVGINEKDQLIVEVRGNEIVLRKAQSIFDHKPPRPRRNVGLTDLETIEVAREEHIREKYGREDAG
jgi:AbrB family looped-hinge helix DNA binding protein